MKVVTTNGCFDILHVGHLRLLKKSRALGDKLIVLINSDMSVKKLKGKNRPIYNQNDRAEMLLAFSFVDEVRIFIEDNPCQELKKIEPTIHVKSVEGYKGLEGPVIDKWGGILVLFPDEKGYSTTNILK